jgi:hypothetical protein
MSRVRRPQSRSSTDAPPLVDALSGACGQRCRSTCATIEVSTVIRSASDMERRARNSNLLPVKANGEVRLRSPPCIGSGGSTGVPSPR